MFYKLLSPKGETTENFSYLKARGMGNSQEGGLKTNKLEYLRKITDSTERHSGYARLCYSSRRPWNLSVQLELQLNPPHSQVITSPWKSDSTLGASVNVLRH